MTLEEFAAVTEMDLAGTLARFAGMENMLVKFLKKFIDDPTFAELSEAVKQEDYAGIERASHTLKGVCGNLGLTGLFRINQDIVDCVRTGEYQNLEELFAQDEKIYENVIANIRLLD